MHLSKRARLIGCVFALLLTGLTDTGKSLAFGGFEPEGGLVCSVMEGTEVHHGGRTGPFNPESVGLPRNFVIDFTQRLILPTADSIVRQRTAIRWVGTIEGKRVLLGASNGVEGVDDGVGWSMSISKKDGQFVTTAAGGRVGYVVFGACVNQ